MAAQQAAEGASRIASQLEGLDAVREVLRAMAPVDAPTAASGSRGGRGTKQNRPATIPAASQGFPASLSAAAYDATGAVAAVRSQSANYRASESDITCFRSDHGRLLQFMEALNYKA